jgi:hypothetical protein
VIVDGSTMAGPEILLVVRVDLAQIRSEVTPLQGCDFCTSRVAGRSHEADKWESQIMHVSLSLFPVLSSSLQSFQFLNF